MGLTGEYDPPQGRNLSHAAQVLLLRKGGERMIVEKIYENTARQIKQYPVNSNRASDLGIPCIRYHVLNRTRWEEKSLHDVGLQLVFNMGNAIEEIVLKELAEAGIKVIEQQRSFQWKEYQITGHIDGMVLEGEEAIPLEIKSCSPFVFKAINTIDDLKNGKYAYLRKYPTQLNLYLLMDNKPRGLFLFKDKTSGAIKEIPMEIDWALGEETLKRAEAINAHVAAGTLPDPINDDLWCGGCAYAHICLPDHIGKEVEIDTGGLAIILDRLDELKAARKEYDELDEIVKNAVEGKEKLLAGNWFISGKWVERKGFTVEGGKSWRRSIKRAA
jgi:CRISPR/Cas system-associated exonuclease Cas4 (RecB family)